MKEENIFVLCVGFKTYLRFCKSNYYKVYNSMRFRDKNSSKHDGFKSKKNAPCCYNNNKTKHEQGTSCNQVWWWPNYLQRSTL